jgi:hypothetical protein
LDPGLGSGGGAPDALGVGGGAYAVIKICKLIDWRVASKISKKRYLSDLLGN